ncbi:MAG: hypothetical protein ACP5GD_00895 [Candidatus Micrarchaeia archaeon]
MKEDERELEDEVDEELDNGYSTGAAKQYRKLLQMQRHKDFAQLCKTVRELMRLVDEKKQMGKDTWYELEAYISTTGITYQLSKHEAADAASQLARLFQTIKQKNEEDQNFGLSAALALAREIASSLCCSNRRGSSSKYHFSSFLRA